MNRLLDWLRQSRRWLWQNISPLRARRGGLLSQVYADKAFRRQTKAEN